MRPTSTRRISPGRTSAARTSTFLPVRSLRVSAEASGRSLFELISSGDSVGGVPVDDMERARAVVQVLRGASAEEKFAEKVEALWKALPGTRELFERHTGDAEAARKLMDAMAFLRSARAYASVSQKPTIQGFVRAGKMLHDDSDTWAPVAPPAEGAVRVLTSHGSKGLEFEAVFVSGLTDDRFPVRARGVQLVDQRLISGSGPTSRRGSGEQTYGVKLRHPSGTLLI